MNEIDHMLELARAGAMERLAELPGVTVRGHVAELALAAGPTLAELESRLGPARELPRAPGPAYASFTFDGHRPLALFAHIDDASGRAVEFIVRRDSR